MGVQESVLVLAPSAKGLGGEDRVEPVACLSTVHAYVWSGECMKDKSYNSRADTHISARALFAISIRVTKTRQTLHKAT